MLDQIRIVLVNTSHRQHGIAARAAKTMGLTQLVLVDPQAQPDEEAVALAAGASDILARARIVPTLDEAIADCGLVIGTSARSRTLSWPMLDPREAGEKLVAEGMEHLVALVFGRERTGLTNDELQNATSMWPFPPIQNTAPQSGHGSADPLLRGADALAGSTEPGAAPEDERVEYPSAQQLEGFYQHLEQTLQKTGFIADDHPGHVMSKLRRLFNRARPEAVELNILRGILTSVQKSRARD